MCHARSSTLCGLGPKKLWLGGYLTRQCPNLPTGRLETGKHVGSQGAGGVHVTCWEQYTVRARTKAALARRILDKTGPKPSHSMVGDVVMQRICAHKKKFTLADGPCLVYLNYSPG